MSSTYVCHLCAVKPPVQMVQLSPQQLGVNVMLSFQHEFSNVLSVFVKVTERGDLPYCVAWIHKLPSVSFISRVFVRALFH